MFGLWLTGTADFCFIRLETASWLVTATSILNTQSADWGEKKKKAYFLNLLQKAKWLAEDRRE